VLESEVAARDLFEKNISKTVRVHCSALNGKDLHKISDLIMKRLGH
jgi:hypothetical protein